MLCNLQRRETSTLGEDHVVGCRKQTVDWQTFWRVIVHCVVIVSPLFFTTCQSHSVLNKQGILITDAGWTTIDDNPILPLCLFFFCCRCSVSVSVSELNSFHLSAQENKAKEYPRVLARWRPRALPPGRRGRSRVVSGNMCLTLLLRRRFITRSHSLKMKAMIAPVVNHQSS